MRIIGTIFLVLQISSSGFAQFKNILLDSAAGGSGRYPIDPAVAINFKTPDNIVVSAFPDQLFVSADGGTTWSRSSAQSKNAQLENPVLISDFSGSIYFMYQSDPEGKAGHTQPDRIVLRRSKDGGNNWDDRSTISLSPPKVPINHGAVADRKGNVFITWTEFDHFGSSEAGCKSQILFSKSSGGSKWTKPFVISKPGDCLDGDSTVRGSTPAVSGDGKLFITWSFDGVIYVDRSFDGGTMWLSQDIPVTEQVGGWKLSVPGIMQANGLPTLVCDNTRTNFNGALYLTWAEESLKGDTEIYFSRSLNFGDNWTQALRINDDERGSHQFMPAMTIDQTSGHIYIVFYDRREYEDDQTDVYLAYSVNNGASFTNVKISESPFLPINSVPFGNKIGIAAHNGVIVPVWTRMDNGKTSIWTSIIKHEDLVGHKPEPQTGKKKKK
ncbi:MAG: exo-alpha-sialidase [Cyclobacteriaceae bacterium]|nr:exo-alpha-sialidase [Cyclobacteriaceae bacterium]